jgi:glycosyltransferase involved in cell wall biosynthesis
MERQHFISIVIPAYNEEKYLGETLKSVFDQDYPRENYEVIVADNNSTDRTGDIARELGAKVVVCPQKGVAATRQTGFEAATGEILVGTDSDTLVSRDWLTKINRVFQDEEIIAVTGSATMNSKSFINRFMAKQLFPVTMSTLFFFGKKSLNGFNFAVRAGSFVKVGGIDKTLVSAEDVDLGIRLAKIGKVVFVPSLTVVTSSRRIDASRAKFFMHHLQNVINFMILGRKPESFEDIR